MVAGSLETVSISGFQRQDFKFEETYNVTWALVKAAEAARIIVADFIVMTLTRSSR